MGVEHPSRPLHAGRHPQEATSALRSQLQSPSACAANPPTEHLQTALRAAGANVPTSMSACASRASSAQHEALVAPSGHLVAFCEVAWKAANVGHEDARFAGDVDAQIPG